MQPQRQVIPVKAAFVSDRGLSQKRPLNEDSYLCDQARGFFAVADGVGGAQAGEVASQTAVEVLDEAFRHQLNANDDVEDLMEIAIQRANNSIYQMAREHPKFSAMATTLVVLHVDGLTATIGHVGDSRLYRLAPDGRLYQETMDHSVVEEEVRAGRMTREQAANHPSRNVISRALGAEANVDVDMKTIKFDDGTTFLLCSDGITRHVSDTEIRTLLGSRRRSLEKICEEMKNLCYERGAEDNLTAVVVRVGGIDQPDDDERTVPTARPLRAEADDYRISQTRPPVATEPRLRAPSADLPAPLSAALDAPKKSGGFFKKLLMFLLFLGGIAGAFFGGIVVGHDRFYHLTQQKVPGAPPLKPAPTPHATPVSAAQVFLEKRNKVDEDAKTWLAERQKEHSGDLLATWTEPEQLYFLGRAYLRQDPADWDKARQSFAKAAQGLARTTSEQRFWETELHLARLYTDNHFAPRGVPLLNTEAEKEVKEILGLDLKATPDKPGGAANTGASPTPAPPTTGPQNVN